MFGFDEVFQFEVITNFESQLHIKNKKNRILDVRRRAKFIIIDLGDFIIAQIEDITNKLAVALNTVGLINIQFAIKNDTVYVIEANPRASRTVPFISKAYREPYVNYATKVMLGAKKVKDFDFKPHKDGYAIKIPVFSFDKFPNVNKELGPEMKSTGEAIRFIPDLRDSYFRKVYSERNLYLSK